MADDHEDRFRRHEAIMEGLARMLEAQHAMNQRVEVFIQQQTEFNADVRTTLARLETLVARMTQQSENGRDA
jgi:hypothetical protein